MLDSFGPEHGGEAVSGDLCVALRLEEDVSPLCDWDLFELCSGDFFPLYKKQKKGWIASGWRPFYCWIIHRNPPRLCGRTLKKLHPDLISILATARQRCRLHHVWAGGRSHNGGCESEREKRAFELLSHLK